MDSTRGTPGQADLCTQGHGHPRCLQLPNADCKYNSETSAAQPSKAFPKVSRSQRSSAQKLLHKQQDRKGVELLEQTGPKNDKG